jgi:hypothetical protein
MLPDADRMERALARGALTGLFIGIEDLLADTDGLQFGKQLTASKLLSEEIEV